MSNGKPRRVSLFGGLLWILLGGLLLVNNLVAKFDFWDLFGRYWPWLLILMGVAKLFDHFASQRTGEPPARLLTGGEVFLLLVLFLVAAGVFGAREFGTRFPGVDIEAPWTNTYSFTEEIARPAKAGVPILIDVHRGDISVLPEDTAQVRVVVNKSVRDTNEDAARERGKEYTVAIQETSGGYQIQAQTTGSIWSNVRLDLEVHVPKQALVTAKTSRGSVRVTGITGNVRTVSAGGDVEIRDVTGDVEMDIPETARRNDVRISGIKGNVKLNGPFNDLEVMDVTGTANIRGSFTGSTRLQNIAKETNFRSRRTEAVIGELKGRLEIGSGSLELYDVPSSVTLTTSSYDITLDNVTGRIRLENRSSGDVTVRASQPPKEEMDITNEKGDVELLLPSTAAFEIAAESRRGDVESDFKDAGLKVDNTEREGKMEGKVGARGPQIRVRTSYGTIHLRKGP